MNAVRGQVERLALVAEEAATYRLNAMIAYAATAGQAGEEVGAQT
jgi:hypothetical protein